MCTGQAKYNNNHRMKNIVTRRSGPYNITNHQYSFLTQFL